MVNFSNLDKKVLYIVIKCSVSMAFSKLRRTRIAFFNCDER